MIKNFRFNGYGDLYVGSAREIRSLYKNLGQKTNMFPRFVDEPTLREDQMYGIHVQEDGQYVILNASSCLKVIIDGDNEEV
jgi:hypothetical protein